MMIFQSHKNQVLLLFFLSAACLLLGMGNAPLFLEEPRRGLVAMEMLYSGDFFHTTVHGAPYYNKPPLFNWVVAAGFRLFGYHEWVLRAITVFSHLATGLMIYAVGKRWLSPASGLLSAGLYLAGADILFYFSLLGEIDVFFSMLVVAGWFCYFHFGEKQEPVKAFAGLYVFMALAFLTKGLPALLFLGFTLLVWQGYKKDWRALFSLPHMGAVLLFLLLLAGYFMPFVVQGDFDTLLLTFWSQSIERTTAETNWLKRALSLLSFPVSLFKDILPGSLLLLFLWKTGIRRAFAANRLIAFCFLVFAANIWVYWVSPDSKSRYLYMFHALMLYPAVWAYAQQPLPRRLQLWVEGFFRYLPYLLVFVLGAGMIAVPFFLKTGGVWWTLPVGLAVALLLLYGARKAGWPLVYLTIVMLILLRGPYGYITGMERKQHSQAATDKKVAIAMAGIIGQQPVFLADSTRISYTISFYLERNLGRVVPFNFEKPAGAFLILPDSMINAQMQQRLGFTYQGNGFSLVQMKE